MEVEEEVEEEVEGEGGGRGFEGTEERVGEEEQGGVW